LPHRRERGRRARSLRGEGRPPNVTPPFELRPKSVTTTAKPLAPEFPQMQCQTYDMGRRCLQPATLASPHCVHHTRSISRSATIGATGVPMSGAGAQPVQPVQQRDFQIEAENASIPLTEDMHFEAAMLAAPSILGCVEPCEKCLSRICHAETRGGHPAASPLAPAAYGASFTTPPRPPNGPRTPRTPAEPRECPAVQHPRPGSTSTTS